MRRWLWFSVCAMLGLVMLAGGLLMPVHLRAVDRAVLQRAGQKSPGLVEHGLALANEKKLGAAQLLWQAAQAEDVLGREQLALAITNLTAQHPDWQVWGDAEPHLEILFGAAAKTPNGGEGDKISGNRPAAAGVRARPRVFTEFVLRHENRARVLALLGVSPRALAHELIRFRAVTNTVLFPPAQSASGQALDAALCVAGLLSEEGRLTTQLSSQLKTLAAEANQGGNSQRCEQALLDLMSLGQRLTWGQLGVFMRDLEDVETLRLMANLVRTTNSNLPVLFSVVELTGKPGKTARYLMEFNETGLGDLGAALPFGAAAVNELLQGHQRVYSSTSRQRIAGYGLINDYGRWAAEYVWRMPFLALTSKLLLYLASGFFLAAAMHFGRPAVSGLELPLQVPGYHVAREILFALGFLLVVLLLSEPFLAQESQRVDFPFRLRLPTMGGVVPAGNPSIKAAIMNDKNLNQSLLALLLFFVLQALLYTSCIFKLAEIRRQKIPPRIKIKLLENEDHLFDAGLYLGFAGTIISLILFSLGLVKPSLMAAYGSTSFGIIFVSIFKIFHLRPARRRLLLEAEAAAPEPGGPVPARTLAVPL